MKWWSSVSVQLISMAACLAFVAGANREEPPIKKPAPIEKKPVFISVPAKQYIYLTWDDAPQMPGTANCINVFSERGVKATFFVVGENIHNNAGRAAIDSLQHSYPQFLLANHSMRHAFGNHYHSFYSLPEKAVDDFIRNDSLFHFRGTTLRLPGSNSWASPFQNKGPASAAYVRDTLLHRGYSIIGWDIEWGSSGSSRGMKGAGELAQEVMDKLRTNSTNRPDAIVILSHDRLFGSAAQTDSLKRFVELLQQAPRHIFETIDHYFTGNTK